MGPLRSSSSPFAVTNLFNQSKYFTGPLSLKPIFRKHHCTPLSRWIHQSISLSNHSALITPTFPLLITWNHFCYTSFPCVPSTHIYQQTHTLTTEHISQPLNPYINHGTHTFTTVYIDSLHTLDTANIDHQTHMLLIAIGDRRLHLQLNMLYKRSLALSDVNTKSHANSANAIWHWIFSIWVLKCKILHDKYHGGLK